MIAPRIAILGCGAISSIGVGFEPHGAGLVAGRSGLSAVPRDPDADHFEATAGAIRDFDPHTLLVGKSLRGMSRSAHLACSAAALVLNRGTSGAGETSPPNARRIGLVAGTAYGNLASMVRFDRETFQEGPRFVDATLFPNTVINSPAGFVSIFFGLRGPNSTLAEGVASSFAALDYAAMLLKRGLADEVLAGGFEALSSWLQLGMRNAGRLAVQTGAGPPRSIPFDATSGGSVLGEGAGFLRLALDPQNEQPLGFIAGRGDAFVPRGWQSGPVDARVARAAMRRAMETALADAGITVAEVGGVWASAAGHVDLDQAEAGALVDVFGARLARLPVVAAKGALGECYGASGVLLTASALHALGTGVAPPSLGLGGEPQHSQLPGLRPAAQPLVGPFIVVNAFDGYGGNRSLVVTGPT